MNRPEEPPTPAYLDRRPDLDPSAALKLWAGRLFIWPGRALYLGRAAATAVHAHHAVQVCIALDGRFRLRRGSNAPWRAYELALILPDRSHQLDADGASLALLYVDPEAHDGRLLASVSGGSFALPRKPIVPALRARLASCADLTCAPEAAADCADALLHVISPAETAPPAQALRKKPDPRIGRLIQRVRDSPEPRLNAADAAALVGLSPNRLQHLFRESTGVPFRRYLLWLRLVTAVESISRGQSLTTVAHAAGFADSAHLSRTFHRMFGIAPSALVKGSQIVSGA